MRRLWAQLFLFPFILVLLILRGAVAGQASSSMESAKTANSSASRQTFSPNGSPDAAVESESPTFELKPDASGAISQEQMRQLFRIVTDKDQENDKRQRDYTYLERDVERQLDGKGQVKSTETKTYEVMEIYGEQVNRLIAKDDKPLSEKDAAKEEEKVQKVTAKRKNESDNDRRKREEKEAKDREEGRKFVNEVADAFNFKLVGNEEVGGREAWVIDAEPRPGYEAHTKEAKFLTKMRGRVWIDKSDLQLSKMDAEALDTITFGLFLARLHKGAHFTMEQTRVNDEVWLPRFLTFNIDARVALLKEYRIAGEQSFKEYKKFRSESKIVGYEEVK